MSLVYRLLGIAARVGEKLRRTRINFIPLSWALIFGLGALVVAGIREVRDAAVNDQTARALGIGEVLGRRDPDRTFVSVKGTLFPQAVFQKKKGSRVEASYLALVSMADKRALLVKYSANRDADGPPAETEISGMLEPLEDGVAAELERSGGAVGGLPFDLNRMLVAGRRPSNLLVWIVITGAAAAFVLALLVTMKNHYVVFRRDDAPEPAFDSGFPAPGASPEQPVAMRASGLFQLDARASRRFLDVPAGLVPLEGGELAIVSNIDASSRFFGVKTADRAGLWAIVMKPEDVKGVELGTLYAGFGRRPALRLRYEDGARKAMQAVLSFDDTAGRAAIRRALPMG